MACFNRMPDLVISLDVVFHQGFDICVGTDQVYVVFYLPAIQETMVKKLREGVAYNIAHNELCVWLTDDDLLKMRKSPVLVQVSVFNVFKEELFASSIERINIDPIFRKRCTYSTSFNDVIPDEVGRIIANYWGEGEHCNPNQHDDAVDALRYATLKWIGTKHDIIGKVTDIHLTPNGLNFHVTPCNNHDTRVKEKPMKTKKDIDRIVITKDNLNAEVLLRAYSGDEIIEKTIAKCSPDDIFDFNIGAKLAVDRLYDGYDMTPKPKRKPYNGMIFVAKYPGTILKPNTLYRVRNGILEPYTLYRVGNSVFTLGREPYIFENMSDDDLTKAVYHTLYSPGGTMDQIKRSTAIHFAKEGKYEF